jgi:hypothetical protein
MVGHIFGRKRSKATPWKESAGARARNAVEDLNGGHRRATLGAGRLSHRFEIVPSDTQTFRILREVLG